MPEVETVPYLRRGAVVALAASVLCVAVGIVLALAAGARGVLPVVRTGVRGWLVSVGGGLETRGTSVGLVPWGAVIVVALVVGWLTTRMLTEEDHELELGGFAASAAGTAGVLAAVASMLTGSDAVSTGIVRSAFGAFAVTGIGVALGAAYRLDRFDALWFTERADVRAVLTAAWRGVVALVAAGFLLVLAMLLPRLDRAGDLWALLDPGLGGGLVLGLLCLAAVPTLALWGVSVLLGPGFAVGADTSVDLTGSHLGPIPGLPVLAALPGPGSFGDWVVVLGLLPVLAGMVAGWTLRVPPSADPSDASSDHESSQALRHIGLGAAAGAAAGLAIGFLVGLSGGAIGPGRLDHAGPPVLTPLLVAVPVLAVGGAIGSALAHYRGERGSDRDDNDDARPARRPRLRWWKQSPGVDRRDEES